MGSQDEALTQVAAEQALPLQSTEAHSAAKVRATPTPREGLRSPNEARQRALLLADFAVLANHVYRPYLNETPCSVEVLEGKTPLPLPSDWALSFDPSDLPTQEQERLGMYWRVYVRMSNKPWEADSPTPVRVALVFRGTDSARDWTSNLKWFVGWLGVETQYDHMAQITRGVIDRYRARFGPAARFYTVGHSLGGGLAQGALYSFPDDVRRAFAFDPSPVTGFYGVDAATRERVTLPINGELPVRIFRIYESGEILAYIRRGLSWIYPIKDHIQEIRFNFDTDGDPIGQHSMRQFACHLLREADRADLDEFPNFNPAMRR